MKYFLLFVTSFAFAQQTKKVDFTVLHATVYPKATEKSVSGSLAYDFTVQSAIDTIRIDAVRMEFSEVRINGQSVRYTNSGKSLNLFEGYKKGKNRLTFSYLAQPKQTMYFVADQIWTQGQGKYTSHWLPSFDDVNEKVIFNISVCYDADFTVLANGKLAKADLSDSKKCWAYRMQQPMSSYLVMLAIGKFTKQTQTAASGTTLEFYLKEEDKAKFETTYKHSKAIFDFFEKEIGVKYPWEVYRQFR
jgi:aminopeptidase N